MLANESMDGVCYLIHPSWTQRALYEIAPAPSPSPSKTQNADKNDINNDDHASKKLKTHHSHSLNFLHDGTSTFSSDSAAANAMDHSFQNTDATLLSPKHQSDDFALLKSIQVIC